jgi:hypothetical protein
MPYDPDLEAFFRELHTARAASDEAEKTAPKENPPHIVILPEIEGDVMARHISAEQVDGEYRQGRNGEIFFYSRFDENRQWYVNKSMSAFRLAAAAFDRCCSFLSSKDEGDEAAFTEAVGRLRIELEAIEPLGRSRHITLGRDHNRPGRKRAAFRLLMCFCRELYVAIVESARRATELRQQQLK